MDRRPDLKGNILPSAVAAMTRSLKSAPDGSSFTHLARDGVLRSWSIQGEVIDCRKLSKEEVMLCLKGMDFENLIKYEEWEDVDGTKLTDAEAWQPEESFWPPSLKNDEKREDSGLESATKSEKLTSSDSKKTTSSNNGDAFS